MSQSLRIFIVPPPSVHLHLQLGWKKNSSFSNGKLLIYDTDDQLVHVFTGLTGSTASLRVGNLTRVIPDKQYRFVFLLPPYLPRQELVKINVDQTDVYFRRLIPFDFSGNGALDIWDFVDAFKLPPIVLLRYFF